jgi:hypothetical protein
MLRLSKLALVGFALVYVLPTGLHAALWSVAERESDWRRSDWSSAGLLESISPGSDAVVLVFSARAGRWRGIFANHSWIVIRPKGATEYTRFDVMGWGTPLRVNMRPPDGRWFGSLPVVIARIAGAEAERAIPQIEAAVAAYPYATPGTYRAWPGPNSNTFVASILDAVPDIDAVLPPTAIGKDYPVDGRWFDRTSDGVFLSLSGYAGVRIGWRDGIEINLFGAVAGIDLRRPALKVPGFGRLGL